MEQNSKMIFDNNTIPSTRTIVSNYYENSNKNRKVRTNLKSIAFHLIEKWDDYEDRIMCFRYSYKDDDKNIILLKRGDKNNKKLNKKEEKVFGNSLYIELIGNDCIFSVKLFTNGCIVITGLGINKYEDFTEKMKYLLNKFDDILDNVFDGNIKIGKPKDHMILCVVKQITHYKINNKKLYKFVNNLNDNKLSAVYLSDKKQMVKIKMVNDEVVQHFEITQNGVIKITVPDIKYISNAVRFITSFISMNLESIIMKDRVEIVLDILNMNKYAPEQGSVEWHKLRENAINASEVYIALGLNKYESIRTFVKKKKEKLNLRYGDSKIPEAFSINYDKLKNKNIIKETTYNDSTNNLKEPMHRGTILEPVARDIYMTLINQSTGSRFPFKIMVYETSSISHWNNKYIRASPDGLVFLFPRNKYPKNIPNVYHPTIDELYKWHNEGIIHDVIALEIKCPMKNCNYSHYSKDMMTECNSGTKMIPTGYWWQIQQQLYVMNIFDCHFFPIKFKIVNNPTIYHKKINNSREKELCKGVFAKVYTDREKGDFIYEYPSNVLYKIKPFTDELGELDYDLIYWKMMDYNIIPVQFSQDEYDVALIKLNKIYKKIIE